MRRKTAPRGNTGPKMHIGFPNASCIARLLSLCNPYNKDVFADSERVIVYYLPGIPGWSQTFGDRPAMLWRPRVAAGDASFGVQAGQFGFTLIWADDRVVVVEACTDLAHPVWSPVRTNTLTGGSTYFSDPRWTEHPSRFYRLRGL